MLLAFSAITTNGFAQKAKVVTDTVKKEILPAILMRRKKILHKRSM